MDVPTSIDQDFDILNDDWWLANVGCDESMLSPEKTHRGTLRISSDGYVLEDTEYKRSMDALADVDEFIEGDNINVMIRNCKLEVSCYPLTGSGTKGLFTIEHCSFLPGSIFRNCIRGFATHARYNYLSSYNDGITVTMGKKEPSIIEYNWIDGPGYRYKDNHADGIQFWQDGHAVIRRNKIEGYDNACILIKSDAPPSSGSDPITDILIEENYLKERGAAYYYLYVCEGETNTSTEYKKRPRYVTVRGNYFESHRLQPIYSGASTAQRAVFVRTESERDEGVKRQAADPSVLEKRIGLGYAASAVDARSWIVWDQNIWVDDRQEVVPPGGWYDISQER